MSCWGSSSSVRGGNGTWSGKRLQTLTCDIPSMSSWMRSVWLYCRMAKPTRKMISRPWQRGEHLNDGTLSFAETFTAEMCPDIAAWFLPHTWIYQRCAWRQEEGGRWGTGWGTRRKRTWTCGNSGSGNGRSALEAAPVEDKDKPLRRKWLLKMEIKVLLPSCGDLRQLGWNISYFFHLQQIFKLVDAEAQLGHAGFEQFPQTVLLHQTHKHTKRLLLWHLGGNRGTCPRLMEDLMMPHRPTLPTEVLWIRLRRMNV